MTLAEIQWGMCYRLLMLDLFPDCGKAIVFLSKHTLNYFEPEVKSSPTNYITTFSG